MKNEILSLLRYCEITGSLFWKISPRKGILQGSIAGSITSKGYVSIKYKNKDYKAHRIVWEMHNGMISGFEIDHINRNKLDNRICNLRASSDSQNKANRKVRMDCTTGFRGVSISRSGMFIARIRAQGINKHLGTYETKESAAKAYLLELQKIYGDFAHQENFD